MEQLIVGLCKETDTAKRQALEAQWNNCAAQPTFSVLGLVPMLFQPNLDNTIRLHTLILLKNTIKKRPYEETVGVYNNLLAALPQLFSEPLLWKNAIALLVGLVETFQLRFNALSKEPHATPEALGRLLNRRRVLFSLIEPIVAQIQEFEKPTPSPDTKTPLFIVTLRGRLELMEAVLRRYRSGSDDEFLSSDEKQNSQHQQSQKKKQAVAAMAVGLDDRVQQLAELNQVLVPIAIALCTKVPYVQQDDMYVCSLNILLTCAWNHLSTKITPEVLDQIIKTGAERLAKPNSASFQNASGGHASVYDAVLDVWGRVVVRHCTTALREQRGYDTKMIEMCFTVLLKSAATGSGGGGGGATSTKITPSCLRSCLRIINSAPKVWASYKPDYFKQILERIVVPQLHKCQMERFEDMKNDVTSWVQMEKTLSRNEDDLWCLITQFLNSAANLPPCLALLDNILQQLMLKPDAVHLTMALYMICGCQSVSRDKGVTALRPLPVVKHDVFFQKVVHPLLQTNSTSTNGWNLTQAFQLCYLYRSCLPALANTTTNSAPVWMSVCYRTINDVKSIPCGGDSWVLESCTQWASILLKGLIEVHSTITNNETKTPSSAIDETLKSKYCTHLFGSDFLKRLLGLCHLAPCAELMSFVMQSNATKESSLVVEPALFTVTDMLWNGKLTLRADTAHHLIGSVVAMGKHIPSLDLNQRYHDYVLHLVEFIRTKETALAKEYIPQLLHHLWYHQTSRQLPIRFLSVYMDQYLLNPDAWKQQSEKGIRYTTPLVIRGLSTLWKPQIDQLFSTTGNNNADEQKKWVARLDMFVRWYTTMVGSPSVSSRAVAAVMDQWIHDIPIALWKQHIDGWCKLTAARPELHRRLIYRLYAFHYEKLPSFVSQEVKYDIVETVFPSKQVASVATASPPLKMITRDLISIAIDSASWAMVPRLVDGISNQKGGLAKCDDLLPSPACELRLPLHPAIYSSLDTHLTTRATSGEMMNCLRQALKSPKGQAGMAQWKPLLTDTHLVLLSSSSS